jgi:hypothetical protein
MYADLFTADGSFNSSRSGKLGTPAVGREALAEAAGGGSKKCEKLARPEGVWIHAIVNLIIEPSADGGATGTSDLVYPSLKGKDFDAITRDTSAATATCSRRPTGLALQVSGARTGAVGEGLEQPRMIGPETRV